MPTVSLHCAAVLIDLDGTLVDSAPDIVEAANRMLAELVCARRPSVATALAELAREAVVVRYADGTWLLAQSALPRRKAPPAPRIPRRRRFVQPASAPAVTRLRSVGDG